MPKKKPNNIDLDLLKQHFANNPHPTFPSTVTLQDFRNLLADRPKAWKDNDEFTGKSKLWEKHIFQWHERWRQRLFEHYTDIAIRVLKTDDQKPQAPQLVPAYREIVVDMFGNKYRNPLHTDVWEIQDRKISVCFSTVPIFNKKPQPIFVSDRHYFGYISAGDILETKWHIPRGTPYMDIGKSQTSNKNIRKMIAHVSIDTLTNDVEINFKKGWGLSVLDQTVLSLNCNLINPDKIMVHFEPVPVLVQDKPKQAIAPATACLLSNAIPEKNRNPVNMTRSKAQASEPTLWDHALDKDTHILGGDRPVVVVARINEYTKKPMLFYYNTDGNDTWLESYDGKDWDNDICRIRFQKNTYPPRRAVDKEACDKLFDQFLLVSWVAGQDVIRKSRLPYKPLLYATITSQKKKNQSPVTETAANKRPLHIILRIHKKLGTPMIFSINRSPDNKANTWLDYYTDDENSYQTHTITTYGYYKNYTRQPANLTERKLCDEYYK